MTVVARLFPLTVIPFIINWIPNLTVVACITIEFSHKPILRSDAEIPSCYVVETIVGVIIRAGAVLVTSTGMDLS